MLVLSHSVFILFQKKDVSQMPCVGVVLSEFVPDAVVKRFERILSCYCDFRKEVSKEFKEKPKRPPPPAIMNTRKGGLFIV